MINSLENNKIDAPNGDYIISTEMIDYNNKVDAIYKNYQSKTKVKVRDGLLEIDTLLKASSEIANACGYWGQFLEVVEYNPKNRTLNIMIGS